MNVVLIIADTFRRDNLGCYGGTYVRTPCLDQFAEDACIFDNAYLTSFPTVPNRHDIMTGRNTSICAGWDPLPPEEITLQQVVGSVGIITALIADTPWLFADGFNYCRDFEAFNWIRGQESDHYASFPRNVTLPCSPEKLRRPFYTMKHYLRNVHGRHLETDYFAAQTMTSAAAWLEQNAGQGPFFLWVDTFDPHEPWDPPQPDVDLYDPGYLGEEVTYPRYGFWREFLTPAEMQHCRALYAGEATLVDRWIGRLLQRIDALGLHDNTAVIFTSDHGFLLGEHGIIGKAINPGRDEGPSRYETLPMYQELVRIPLLIRMPGQAGGKRVKGLIQSHDLMPTILELCGIIMTEPRQGMSQIQVLQCGMFKDRSWQFEPTALHGSSLVPLITGERARVRDLAISANSLTVPTPVLAKCAVTTEDGWCLFYSGTLNLTESDPRLKPATATLLRDAVAPYQPALYYLPEDPRQECNLINERKDLALDIHRRYLACLEEQGTAPEYLASRRQLFTEES